MTTNNIPLAQEIDRVPSSTVPLDAREETRFDRIMDAAVMVDVHQHPFVMPEVMEQGGNTSEAAAWVSRRPILYPLG